MGTGWLGWSADVTLDTHMALIVEAYQGRAEMLGAIFGGGKDKAAAGRSNSRRTPEPRMLRGVEGMAALKTFAAIHAKK